MRGYYEDAYQFLVLASLHDRRESAVLIEKWIRKLAATNGWADKEDLLGSMVALSVPLPPSTSSTSQP